MLHLEWIHCLNGRRGVISIFPAEMVAEKGTPGLTFRLSGTGVKISPDFRAKNISVNGKTVLSSARLEPDVPAFLRMGKTLLAVCVTEKQNGDWANYYRFPLWTIFDPETLEPLGTVRSPREIPDLLKNERRTPENCLASPYGLTLTIPLDRILDLFEKPFLK